MLDLVIIDGRARGVIVRNLVTGELERYSAHAVVVATGGYGNVYFLSTNAMLLTALWLFSAIVKVPILLILLCSDSPYMYPVHGEYQSKLTLMSESPA